MVNELTDPRIAQWTQLVTDMGEMARRAEADPGYKASLNLDTIALAPEVSPRAALLRACATKAIPPEFNWEVVQTVGGHAFLTLRGFTTGVD